MFKDNEKVATPKTVSADTKNNNLALPLSSAITMEVIKKSCRMGVGADLQSPSVILALLIGTKEVCTTAHLNEMFHLNDTQPSYLFNEGIVDRDIVIENPPFSLLSQFIEWLKAA